MGNILLGITGSVAALKAQQLATALRQLGKVKTVTTQAGYYFLHRDWRFDPQGNPLYRDEDEWPQRYALGDPVLHIELRRWAGCLLIAPLDANTLAKIHQGICDNLLTCVYRAWDWSRPVIVAPAMNTLMWENQPTAEQIASLKKRGVGVVGPVDKRLACADVGMGAMASIEDIVNAVPSTG